MLKFNLLIALRTMKRYRFYSALNIIGLVIGITCSVFISLYVLDELSFDHHLPDHDRIYRINQDTRTETHYVTAATPYLLAEALKDYFPEIEHSGHLFTQPEVIFKKDEGWIRLNQVRYASQSILDIFQFPVLHGQLNHALVGGGKAVITASTAKNFFNKTDVIGKVITTKEGTSYHIACVIDDPPTRTHLELDALLPIQDSQRYKDNHVFWVYNTYRTYVKLKPGKNEGEFRDKMHDFMEDIGRPINDGILGEGSWSEMLSKGYYMWFPPMKISSIRTHFKWHDDIITGTIGQVFILLLVGVIILINAIVNFVNLSTARAHCRAKEVGIRKILGSHRRNLIIQFQIESFLYCIVALMVSVVVCYLLLPYFNSFTDSSHTDPFFNVHHIYLYLLYGIAALSLFSGTYPAIVLSSLHPIKVFKGQTIVTSGKRLRNLLTGFQFTLSIILIICMIISFGQLLFINNIDRGFDSDKVLIINGTSILEESLDSFKAKIEDLPSVASASVTSYFPSSKQQKAERIQLLEDPKEDILERNFVEMLMVDPNYISVLNLSLIEGRFFSDSLATDSEAIVINESAAKHFGKTDLIGKKVHSRLGEKTIIGITKDMRYRSIHEYIRPQAYYYVHDPKNVLVRFQSDNLTDFFEDIESVWQEFMPGMVMSYEFLEDRYNHQYDGENKFTVLATLFTTIALFIACMGLLGLTAYITEKRRKEIGIRKVLGAKVSQIIGLLISGFAKPILLAIIIGSPIGYYLMDGWLNNYDKRIDIEWWTILTAGLVATVFGWLTVSYQSFKSARANPTENLRYE